MSFKNCSFFSEITILLILSCEPVDNEIVDTFCKKGKNLSLNDINVFNLVAWSSG